MDELTPEARPWLIRGDCNFGNESLMAQAEARERKYLFKLRLTRKPKDLIRQMEQTGGWKDAGQGWQGQEGTLRLQGWSRSRRVIILRRKLAQPRQAPALGQRAQLLLNWAGLFPGQGPSYEYAGWVTSLTEEILPIAQLYRDRADRENNFDELSEMPMHGKLVTCGACAKRRRMKPTSTPTYRRGTCLSPKSLAQQIAELNALIIVPVVPTALQCMALGNTDGPLTMTWERYKSMTLFSPLQECSGSFSLSGIKVQSA